MKEREQNAHIPPMIFKISTVCLGLCDRTNSSHFSQQINSMGTDLPVASRSDSAGSLAVWMDQALRGQELQN